MRFTVLLMAVTTALTLALSTGCGAPASEADPQAEWREALRRKPAATGPEASLEEKQAYADSVREFVAKHPEHARGREVWARLQLEFADELAEAGRYQDAIRFYRAVLIHHPESEHARRGLALAADRLAVSREKLLALRKGMTPREVAGLLGKPIPGWKIETRRSGARFEAWYYRTRQGSLAAVYFRNGHVLAAEESSDARVGRLGS